METYLIIMVILLGMFVFAKYRQATSVVQGKPSQLRTFLTILPPEEVLKIVSELPGYSKYKLEDVNAGLGRVIMSEAPTATTWGFFYPVYVSKVEDGNTLVEVGIKSRLVQVGRLVGLSHEKFVDTVRNAVAARE